MGDSLSHTGGGIGSARSSVRMLQRRGGLLPQLDRVRGQMAVEFPFISFVVVDSYNRKLKLSISFQDGV